MIQFNLVPTKSVASLLARLTVLVGLLSFLGCLGPRPDQRRYYGLGELSLPKSTAKSLPNTGLVVPTFEVGSTYDRQQMCERLGPVEVSYPRDHLWVDKPHRLFNERMVGWLRATGLFSKVASVFNVGHPRWVMGGEVLAVEVQPRDKGWSTRLRIRLSLREVKSGVLIWRRDWDLRKRLRGASYAAAARAISDSYQQILQQSAVALKPFALKAMAAPDS